MIKIYLNEKGAAGSLKEPAALFDICIKII